MYLLGERGEQETADQDGSEQCSTTAPDCEAHCNQYLQEYNKCEYWVVPGQNSGTDQEYRPKKRMPPFQRVSPSIEFCK